MTHCMCCGKDFKYFKNFLNHFRRCEPIYLYILPEFYKKTPEKINNIFNDKYKIIKNDKNHKLKYGCDICGKIYNHKNYLYQHRKSYCKQKITNSEYQNQELNELVEKKQKILENELDELNNFTKKKQKIIEHKLNKLNQLTEEKIEFENNIIKSEEKQEENIIEEVQPELIKHNNKTKFVKNKRISNAIKEQVWFKYIGNLCKAKCVCCNDKIITAFYFECGHVIPESCGGKNTVDNLRPICGFCNRCMGTQIMTEYMENNCLKKTKNWYGINSE